MNLEENLEKLKDITEKLESGKIGLDDSVKLFEEGAELVKQCLKDLKTIKGKITVIKKDIDKFVEEEIENEN